MEPTPAAGVTAAKPTPPPAVTTVEELLTLSPELEPVKLHFFNHALSHGVWNEGRREFAKLLISCCHPHEQEDWSYFLAAHARPIREAIAKNCWDFYGVTPALLLRTFATPRLLRVAAAVYLKGLERGVTEDET